MSICSNCKSEGTRIRTIFGEDGTREECPHCSPGSFDKVTDPSDKKIWMGYEAHPNEYVRGADGGFDRKPEYRAEQEARLMQETEEERTLREAAEAKKRRERRTAPMDAAELAAAMHKAEEIAGWVQGAAAQGTDLN
jgi:hypothetical protein